MIGLAVWSLCSGAGRRLAVAPFLPASLAGEKTVALFRSVMVVPRVTLLLLAFSSMQPNRETKISA